MAAPQKCDEPENKRKPTEPERERKSDDLMDLNNTEHDASNKSGEDFVL